MRRLLFFTLPLAMACGDIIVSPDGNGGESTTSNGGVAVEVDGGIGALDNQIPIECAPSEPAPPSQAILLYADAGVASDDDASIPVCGSTTGGACEYGNSLDRACNHTYTCESQLWKLETDSQTCFDKACPAATSKLATIDGTPCDLGTSANPNDEAICPVTDGTCICTTGGPNGNVHGRTWVCAAPTFGCPLHRPMLGSDCDDVVSSTTCDYGSCTSKRGSAVTCQNNQWLETSTSCN